MEIFGCSSDIPFAGISVIACGDFYQLPPIQQRPVYAKFDDVMLNISHCWRLFKIAELTKVMRQTSDQESITLLNNIRNGNIIENDEKILKPKFIKNQTIITVMKNFIFGQKMTLWKGTTKKCLIHCLVQNA